MQNENFMNLIFNEIQIRRFALIKFIALILAVMICAALDAPAQTKRPIKKRGTEKTNSKTVAVVKKENPQNAQFTANASSGSVTILNSAETRPNDTDKKYLVKEFLKSLYAVEQTTRESQINKLLRMLDPDLSLAFAGRLKQNGLLAAEKAESVNSSWELQDLTVDERDPYVLRAIGIRRVRRKANGQDVIETLQLKCKFLLKDSPSSPARNDNNLRTGFSILRFRVEPVSGKTVSPVALLADAETSNDDELEQPQAADSNNNAEPKR